MWSPTWAAHCREAHTVRWDGHWVAGLGVSPGQWAHREPAPHHEPADELWHGHEGNDADLVRSRHPQGAAGTWEERRLRLRLGRMVGGPLLRGNGPEEDEE